MRQSVTADQQVARTVADRVEQNLPLVGHLVRETLNKVPTHVNRDDLVSAGMLALTVSAQSFDAERGVPFARYASIRIRGALLDELRGMDWAARSVRSKARETEAVRNQLVVTLQRTPRAAEVAAAMGMSRADLDHLECDLARARTISLGGFGPEISPVLIAEPSPGPEALLLLRETLGYLHDAIAELPERLRFVVTAYFFEQRQMTDIGAELGVSESRVSQLRAEALHLLRDGMNSQLDPAAEAGAAPSKAAPKRAAYHQAIGRGTVHSRLAMTTPRGQMRPGAGVAPLQVA